MLVDPCYRSPYFKHTAASITLQLRITLLSKHIGRECSNLTCVRVCVCVCACVLACMRACMHVCVLLFRISFTHFLGTPSGPLVFPGTAYPKTSRNSTAGCGHIPCLARYAFKAFFRRCSDSSICSAVYLMTPASAKRHA